MMLSGLGSDMPVWRRLPNGSLSGGKTQDHKKNGKIDRWRKRVEKAAQFGASPVTVRTKRAAGTCAVTQSSGCDLLKHQNEAHMEAQALLSEWMNTKIRLELDEAGDEDAPCDPGSSERSSPLLFESASPTHEDYENFNDLYYGLAAEEEERAVSSILRELMERDVLDDATKKNMEQDDDQIRKRLRDPAATMEARHRQVREKRAQREAEKQKQQREREAEKEAREEARRKQQREDARRKRAAQRQEELLQQEMVKLRRQLEERKRREQLLRQREREKVPIQTDTAVLLPASPCCPKQEQPDPETIKREQRIDTMIHIQNLKCLQRQLSAWYSVVLDQRLHMDKAAALCDWKRMLRVWRAWRAAVWEEKKRQERARTEQELQKANRQNQAAEENHRQRLLRRCLTEWRLCCRMEKKQREISSKQQEIQRKVAALLDAVSAAKAKAADAANNESADAPPEPPNQPESSDKVASHSSCSLDPNTSAAPQKDPPAVRAGRPTQPWQVTRRHTAPTEAEVQQARWKMETQRPAGPGVGRQGGSRHALTQREIITQQRKRLKEQQEQIALLTEQQKMKGLEVDMERLAQLAHASLLGGSTTPESGSGQLAEDGESRVQAEPRSPPRRAAAHSHPIIAAMEARAQLRAERRRQIEDLKRKKEEEKLAQMKAAEERQRREREEEKRKAAERRNEQKRLEKEREEEKQRELRRQEELLKVAHQHRGRALLRRGLAQWKRLMRLQQDAAELAERHHQLSLLRRCTLAWQQSVRDSLSRKRASADQLYRDGLLRRGLSGWKRLMQRRAAEELRAAAFHRSCTLRRFLAALAAHVTSERLRQWDHQELAHKHSHRRALQRCLRAWSRLPGLQRQEREKALRRERLSKKVAEVLPNFYSYLHAAQNTSEDDEPQSESSDAGD